MLSGWFHFVCSFLFNTGTVLCWLSASPIKARSSIRQILIRETRNGCDSCRFVSFVFLSCLRKSKKILIFVDFILFSGKRVDKHIFECSYYKYRFVIWVCFIFRYVVVILSNLIDVERSFNPLYSELCFNFVTSGS